MEGEGGGSQEDGKTCLKPKFQLEKLQDKIAEKLQDKIAEKITT